MKAALAIALLVALAGCGGGSSRQNFIEDATAICADTTDRVRALGTPDSFTATQLFARQAKDAVGDGINELDDLTPPEELDDAFGRYLATLEARRTVLGRMGEAADANSMKGLQEVGSELDVVNARAKSQARRAGLPDCEAG